MFHQKCVCNYVFLFNKHGKHKSYLASTPKLFITFNCKYWFQKNTELFNFQSLFKKYKI